MTVGADESDEYHESQLREKPEDTSTHSNYGVFLKEKKSSRAKAQSTESLPTAMATMSMHWEIWQISSGRKGTEIRRPGCHEDPRREGTTMTPELRKVLIERI